MPMEPGLKTTEPKTFQRNYAIRSVGAATLGVVEEYVAKQTDHHPMADLRVRDLLQKYQRTYPDVDLSQPAVSSHGQHETIVPAGTALRLVRPTPKQVFTMQKRSLSIALRLLLQIVII